MKWKVRGKFEHKAANWLKKNLTEIFTLPFSNSLKNKEQKQMLQFNSPVITLKKHHITAWPKPRETTLNRRPQHILCTGKQKTLKDPHTSC